MKHLSSLGDRKVMWRPPRRKIVPVVARVQLAFITVQQNESEFPINPSSPRPTGLRTSMACYREGEEKTPLLSSSQILSEI